jgi:hypothetical protein
MTIAQIGIEYRASSLSESQAGLDAGAPRAGDRFPWVRLKLQRDGPVEDLFAQLDDTRFNLLLFNQSSAPGQLPELGDRLRVHPVPSDPVNDKELARQQIPQPSFYLLRPDGHVGLAGIHFDAAAASRYLLERLHIAQRAT